MKQIYALEHFNNYFNHKVIKYDTLEEYLHNSDKYEPLAGVNFNPADGVNTTHIINAIDINPDYLLVVDDANNIVSRWFITDAVQIRNGQHKLSLLRDVIAEHYSEVIDAPCLVDRAMVDTENPLLYNAEGDNTFNQIKQSEHLLKDETNTNWIVGYIARDTNIEGDISSITQPDDKYRQLDGLVIQWNNENDLTQGGTIDVANNVELMTHLIRQRGAKFWDIYDKIEGVDLTNLVNTTITQYGLGHQAPGFITVPNDTTTDQIRDNWHMNLHYKKIVAALKTYYDSIRINLINATDLDDVMACRNQIVYSLKHQKYYRLTINNTVVKQEVTKLPANNIPNVLLELDTIATNLTQGLGISFQRYSDPYEITLNYSHIYINLQEVTAEGIIKTQISANRQHLIDAPFDMFAIPYSVNNYNLAQQINLKLASSIYDMQILPYCPVRELISTDGISLLLGKENVNYSHIKDSDGTNISYILWASKSSDVFRIRHKITIPNNNIDLKVYSETTFIRLVSPNYNGVFEFNAAKNGGVDYFEVSFTYKPYSPYIHVNPNFKGLYGTDFNDARGLQCNGDFSVSMTSDAWKQYEINNKNYQNIFNTEIKTMDENQKLQNISNGISAGLNALTTGALLGITTGNPYIGLFGAAASGMAGFADMGIQNQMYGNNRQAKIDTFNMSLGNIKARPDSLTKVSAHTITNKYFPFVEIYSSTDVEKEIYKNKLTYYGMSIKALGKISDYINIPNFSYFKGSLVRLDSIKDDTHVVNQIAQELNGGLYF